MNKSAPLYVLILRSQGAGIETRAAHVLAGPSNPAGTSTAWTDVAVPERPVLEPLAGVTSRKATSPGRPDPVAF
jgi:hypothetical protein